VKIDRFKNFEILCFVQKLSKSIETLILYSTCSLYQDLSLQVIKAFQMIFFLFYLSKLEKKHLPKINTFLNCYVNILLRVCKFMWILTNLLVWDINKNTSWQKMMVFWERETATHFHGTTYFNCWLYLQFCQIILFSFWNLIIFCPWLRAYYGSYILRVKLKKSCLRLKLWFSVQSILNLHVACQ